MNDRIKELAERARKALATDAMSGGKFDMQAYEEKFAELIVSECMDVFSEDLPDPTNPDYQLGTLNEVINRVCNVAEHFGVER